MSSTQPNDLDEAAAAKAAAKKAEKERAKAERKAKKKEHKAADKLADDLADTSITKKQPKGANYNIGLKGTENGIVTRFPPEPSGYLHIGHAKAALLNDYFAHEFLEKGRLILRFDDTNPTKEKQEFQDAIVQDLRLLGIKEDKLSYTSDYFELLYDYCVKLIEAGLAYADDTDQETMSRQRLARERSARRDESVADSLARFKEMGTGSEEGKKWFIRAKIAYDDKNAALRDPAIYRCNDQPHHRTGTKWKIYPLYDFACAVVDSIEGVTHALRTIEYRDHNALYEWIQEKLDLRPVEIFDFSKLSFIQTVLSKRKLTKLVDMGVVSGWDDPRMPTVRGIRRRGMTISALREFMVSQGPSKNIVLMDWFTIWTMNKKTIDAIAPRLTAIAKEHAVKCTVIGAPVEAKSEEKPKHKNAEVGMKKVVYSQSVLIEQDDAKSFAQDEEITLMNWGNAFVRKITRSSSSDVITEIELELHLAGDFKKTEKKITWLSADQKLVPVELVQFELLFTKDRLEDDDIADLENCKYLNRDSEHRTSAVADCNVWEVKADSIVQFDRKGFFRCDRAAAGGEGVGVFFGIPSGRSK